MNANFQFLILLVLILNCGVAAAESKKECEMKHSLAGENSEATLPISQGITKKTYGIFQVTVELKKNGSTVVAIEAKGMKTMQSGSGSGVTKASLSNGAERLEVLCK